MLLNLGSECISSVFQSWGFLDSLVECLWGEEFKELLEGNAWPVYCNSAEATQNLFEELAD